MTQAISNTTLQGTRRKRRAPELRRWASSAMSSFSCAVANGNRVAPAHAAAPSAAALRPRRLPARQQPARASFSRRCRSACGSMKNTLLPNRSGNGGTAMFLNTTLALAGAFGGGSGRTAVPSLRRGNPRGRRAVILTPGAVLRRLTFARARLPMPSQSSSPNPPVERDAPQAGFARSLRAPHLAR